MAEHPGKGPRASGVAGAVDEGDAVARDHDAGMRDGLVDELVLHHVDDDPAAFFPILVEGRFGQPLAGRGPTEIRVVDPEVTPPPRIEERRFEHRRRGRVGIDLGGQILSRGASRVDQCQCLREVPAGAAADVDDMERRTGVLRGADRFPDGADAEGPGMHEHRNLLLRGNGEHRLDFSRGGARRIVDSKSDTERPVGEPLSDGTAELLGLGVGRGLIGAGGHRAQFGDHGSIDGPVADLDPVEHEEAGGDMADGGAEVERRFTLTGAIPRVDRIDADLEFEGGGDPVLGLELHVAGGLAVGMEIDEPRRHDLAGDVDDLGALERLGRDRGDLAGRDADAPNRVKTGRRVHDVTALEDQVVVGRLDAGSHGQNGREGKGSGPPVVHPHFNPSFESGRLRTRRPDAAKIALQSAGTTGGNAGSPMPVGELSVSLK